MRRSTNAPVPTRGTNVTDSSGASCGTTGSTATYCTDTTLTERAWGVSPECQRDDDALHDGVRQPPLQQKRWRTVSQHARTQDPRRPPIAHRMARGAVHGGAHHLRIRSKRVTHHREYLSVAAHGGRTTSRSCTMSSPTCARRPPLPHRREDHAAILTQRVVHLRDRVGFARHGAMSGSAQNALCPKHSCLR